MAKVRLPDNITWGDKYDNAMKVKNEDEAREYLEACIEQNMRVSEHTREEAEAIERSNIGYWTGYYDPKTANRVMRLFGVVHPFFGTTQPTPEEALTLDMKLAKERADKVGKDED